MGLIEALINAWIIWYCLIPLGLIVLGLAFFTKTGREILLAIIVGAVVITLIKMIPIEKNQENRHIENGIRVPNGYKLDQSIKKESHKTIVQNKRRDVPDGIAQEGIGLYAPPNTTGAHWELLYRNNMLHCGYYQTKEECEQAVIWDADRVCVYIGY